MGSSVTMNRILCWNCRGLGSPAAITALRGVLSTEDPQIVFLSETKLKSWEMDKVKEKLRFSNMIAVSCEGDGRRRKGALVLLWQHPVDILVQGYTLNYIDVIIVDQQQGEWRFIGVYGYPKEEKKKDTGHAHRALKKDMNTPWLCGGDFNLMLVS